MTIVRDRSVCFMVVTFAPKAVGAAIEVPLALDPDERTCAKL